MYICMINLHYKSRHCLSTTMVTISSFTTKMVLIILQKFGPDAIKSIFNR